MEQRNDFTIDKDGISIRWEKLDSGMHISSFYETSNQRLQQIRTTLHSVGTELQSV